jgi:hypothetical protein
LKNLKTTKTTKVFGFYPIVFTLYKTTFKLLKYLVVFIVLVVFVNGMQWFSLITFHLVGKGFSSSYPCPTLSNFGDCET